MAKKILKRVEITLIGCEEDITYVNAEDTEDNPTNGKYALDQFKAKEQLHFINNNNKECYVPFHAIESVYVNSRTVKVTKPSPYGCGDTGPQWSAIAIFCNYPQYEGLIPVDSNGIPIPGRYHETGDDGYLINEGEPNPSAVGISIYAADEDGHFEVKFKANGSCGNISVNPNYDEKTITASLCC